MLTSFRTKKPFSFRSLVFFFAEHWSRVMGDIQLLWIVIRRYGFDGGLLFWINFDTYVSNRLGEDSSLNGRPKHKPKEKSYLLYDGGWNIAVDTIRDFLGSSLGHNVNTFKNTDPASTKLIPWRATKYIYNNGEFLLFLADCSRINKERHLTFHFFLLFNKNLLLHWYIILAGRIYPLTVAV